jgi:hypothetical protein
LFPQALSLFYTGSISDKLGAFLQLTWNPSGNSVGIDNSDLRFADHAAFDSIGIPDFIYGLTLNNNPTSQDVWNSTPAWGEQSKWRADHFDSVVGLTYVVAAGPTQEAFGRWMPRMSKVLPIGTDSAGTPRHCSLIFKAALPPCGRSYPKLPRESVSSSWKRFARSARGWTSMSTTTSMPRNGAGSNVG